MEIANSKILVTGGAGFIGSHIVERLVRGGASVTVYDNFSSGSMENLRAVEREIEIIRGDLLDYPKLAQAMQGVGLVSHQAAQLEILKCLDDPLWDLQVNTGGTINVLRAAVKNGVRKVVVASSACVYGQAQAASESEEHQQSPNWAYGVSKLAAEHYCRIFQENYGLPVVNLRYAIIYGPREWYGRVLTIFLKRMLLKQPLVIFGDGEQRRDFTFVEDVVEMHQICLTSEAANGKAYNVSTGIGTTINRLAELVAELGGGLKTVHENISEGAVSKIMPERVRLPAELRTMVLNPARAKSDLGWSAQTDLRAGIHRQIEWLKENLKRWETVHI